MFFKNRNSGVQWIVVFLGNPGDKYAKTRHNAGFMTAAVLEKQENQRISRLRFNALTAIVAFGGEKALLMKPQTFMNLSGNAVAPAAAFYKLPPERIIVVCDDVALPLGALRIRTKGSSGGHNGLKSIISALGTEEFPRVKIGVGEPVRSEGESAMIDWVLGELRGKEAKLMDESCENAACALRTLITEGAQHAMNKFN